MSWILVLQLLILLAAVYMAVHAWISRWGQMKYDVTWGRSNEFLPPTQLSAVNQEDQ